MNVRRAAVALLTGLGIAALASPSLHTPVPRIVYNPSDSVPPGWYRIGPLGSLHIGSIVLARLPADAAALAAQRGYLPFRVQSCCTSFAPQPAVAVLHPCRPSPPDRRGRSRQQSGKAEGKIKGRGTLARRKPCLHVGWRGTRISRCRAVCGAKAAPALACRRASRARLGSATPESMP
jgi:hypothetical protein